MAAANGYSPPDFDFSMPCHVGFKSEFARSLSLNIAAGVGNQRSSVVRNWSKNVCCKSIDYNANIPQSDSTSKQRSSNSSIRNIAATKKDCPPLLPQRLSCAIGTKITSPPTIVRSNSNSKCKNNKQNTHVPTKNEASTFAIGSDSAGGGGGGGCCDGDPVKYDNDCVVNVPTACLYTKDAATTTEPTICSSSSPTPVLPARRALLTNGRKNTCNDSTLTLFTRHPANENNSNVLLNGDIEPVCFGTNNTNTGNSLRKNNDQRYHIGGYQHVCGHHDQYNTNDADANGNGNAVVANIDYNDEDCDDHADDNDVDVEQNCSLCNESLTNAQIENETDFDPTVKPSPALPPKKHQNRAMPLPSSHPMKMFPIASSMPVYEPVGQQETKTNLENVILQNEMHTLRWKLKQMDTRCEMQRAVLEEMARFLDRYHSHTQRKSQEQHQISMEQMPRSKSLFHVNGIDSGRSSSNSNASTCGKDNEKENTTSIDSTQLSNYLRVRSSTNLIEVNGGKTNKFSNEVGGSESNTYCAFKDYTWRRLPKKLTNNRISNALTMDEVDMKLSQEAFRLSRTIHNLLNGTTQQPLNSGRLIKAPSNISIMTLQHGASNLHNSTSLTMAANDSSSHLIDHNTDLVSNKSLRTTEVNNGSKKQTFTTTATATSPVVAASASADINFQRSHDLRDSRLSMRSSTDSSVHSLTSSSTDEDAGLSLYHPNVPPVSLLTPKQLQMQQQQPHHLAKHHYKHQHRQPVLASTTEDESGFSSISSFQEIGVPITTDVAPIKAVPLHPAPLRILNRWEGTAAARNNEDSVLWV